MTDTHGPMRCAAIALCAVCLSFALDAQPIRPAPAFKGEALVAPPTTAWPTNGGNWYNQRYSPLTEIDRGNVASLKGVWRTRLRGSGVGTKYSGEAQPIRPAPAFKGEAPVAPPTTAWPTTGGNWYNQRYSPLTEINRDNVARLKGVWRTRLRGSGLGPQYSGEAQPVVYGGVIYIVTGADDVFAVGVETGNILWEYKSNLDSNIDSVCCGWVSRGVAQLILFP
jgi:glucose dehydrogenase